MEKREEYIDAVAGLMILWMILGHLQQVAGYGFEYPNVLFFFMPWFYYKSGMLSKPKGFVEQAKGGGRKFAKPFVIYGLIGQIVLTICMLIEHVDTLKPYIYSPIRSLVLGGTWTGNTPLWFLPSLFVTICVFSWLRGKHVNGFIIALIGLCSAFVLNRIGFAYMPVYIGSGLMGVFFYAMGKMLHAYQGNHYVFSAAVICLVGLYALRGLPPVGIRHIAQGGGSVIDFFQWVLMALAGCFAVNNVFKYLQPLLKFTILQYVGRNAMTFYVLHWIVLLLTIRLIVWDLVGCWNSYVVMAAGLASCTVFIPLFIYVKNRIMNNE